MTKKRIAKLGVIVMLAVVAGYGRPLLSQASATITETTNQRNTIGTLTAVPVSNVKVGDQVQFNYWLQTAGAPAPTTETVQFYDGTTQIGTPQVITLRSASNLIPYAQIDTSKGWTIAGSTPTVTINSVAGPDGSAASGTAIVFPNTTAGTSGVSYAVPSAINYSGQVMTFSVWAQSAMPTTIQLKVTDQPQVAASQSTTCSVMSSWNRCSISYTFPGGSGTGFAVSIVSSSLPTQTVNVWGAQFETGAAPGPFVSTIGTARPTNGQAGTLTFPYSNFLNGAHSITVQYPGDANFVASTSNPIDISVGKGSSSVVLTDSPVGTSVYGVAVVFTAQVSGPTATPTGTVEFFDGAISLGTGIVDGSGKATLTTVGATSLSAGSHPVTAVYSGDANFNTSTSNQTTHVVTQASGAVTTVIVSGLNPAIYGDSVTFTLTVSSPVGVTPTGTVTVMDGASSLGVVTLNAAGTGTLTVPTFTAGAHTITATYSGDTNYH
jgi:Bacterial Ig-like domain (group 3)